MQFNSDTRLEHFYLAGEKNARDILRAHVDKRWSTLQLRARFMLFNVADYLIGIWPSGNPSSMRNHYSYTMLWREYLMWPVDDVPPEYRVRQDL